MTWQSGAKTTVMGFRGAQRPEKFWFLMNIVGSNANSNKKAPIPQTVFSHSSASFIYNTTQLQLLAVEVLFL